MPAAPLLAALLALATVAGQAAPPPSTPHAPAPGDPRAAAPAPARASRILHLRVIGDLETGAMAAAIAAELERAPRERFTSVVLELEFERARPDLVWTVGQAVRASRVPVIGFIHAGRGGGVGAGALAIGVLAHSCHVAPRTVIRHSPVDELRWLAPAGTNWERTGRELSGALWLALKDRSADPALAAVLASPAGAAWAGSPDDSLPWRIAVGAAPPSGRWEQVAFETEAGFERLELSAETAAALGVARVDTATVAQVIAATAPPPSGRATRTVAGDLEASRQRTERHIRLARDAVARAEAALDIRARARGRAVTTALYHEGAREATGALDAADAALKDAEDVGVERPEVLRHPPVSRETGTRKVVPPVVAAIAEVRKEIDRLRTRAREHAAR
ncbi:MAG: hypothetical protein WD749_06645 [Phycisphaerales bacterium]